MESQVPILQLREALLEDSSVIFAWRNDPETVRNSLSQAPVQYEVHERWFAKKLRSAESLFLVAERLSADEPEAIGICRFDLAAGNTAVVNINVAPSERGKGFGKAILESAVSYLRQAVPEIRLLNAEVMETNFSSRSIFEKAGFELLGASGGVMRYQLDLVLKK